MTGSCTSANYFPHWDLLLLRSALVQFHLYQCRSSLVLLFISFPSRIIINTGWLPSKLGSSGLLHVTFMELVLPQSFWQTNIYLTSFLGTTILPIDSCRFLFSYTSIEEPILSALGHYHKWLINTSYTWTKLISLEELHGSIRNLLMVALLQCPDNGCQFW